MIETTGQLSTRSKALRFRLPPIRDLLCILGKKWGLIAVLLCWGPVPAGADDNDVEPSAIEGTFDNMESTYNPWAGVDNSGNIHGIDGQQLAVKEDGSVTSESFSPSVAVADLNGDGKPDLIMADTKGFLWYYSNSGTPQKPAFTQGEIIPVWLGELRLNVESEAYTDIVPRIQVVDFDNRKLLDILAGTYAGKLFRIRNTGSITQPNFQPVTNTDSMVINTYSQGKLWCNYLSPFLTNMFNPSGPLDLIMGEGTYSANSIYLLHNTGSTPSPVFDENHRLKIIPGMGLEQLTPVVLDWNNDGKPDILTGDRTGYLTLYLNTSTSSDHPTFAPGKHITVGGQEKLGNATTVALGDLTDNKLPNLLIGLDDGTVLYALNTGKIGAPVFSTPATPLKGVLPPDYHYQRPTDWSKFGVWGVPDELLSCVNPQVEPGFAFPPDLKVKNALKFSVVPTKITYFPDHYYPKVEDDLNEHGIQYKSYMNFKLRKRYRVHFWIKADHNISNLRFKFYTRDDNALGYDHIERPVNASEDWSETSTEVTFEAINPNVKNYRFGFEFRFNGQGTIYITDLKIQEM